VAISCAAAACGGSRPSGTAGFYYADGSFVLPGEAAARLGGPLTDRELTSIKERSFVELQRAFSEFRIIVSDSPRAFWRVQVVPALRPRGALPNSGESLALGFLGGAGAVGFDIVSLKAAQFAPPGASRQTIIDGIGRGIGRVAAHEFAHQIAGNVDLHTGADANSYEHASPDRASQYYGELRWTTARPFLTKKLGR
jgi:hypothetical protein